MTRLDLLCPKCYHFTFKKVSSSVDDYKKCSNCLYEGDLNVKGKKIKIKYNFWNRPRNKERIN